MKPTVHLHPLTLEMCIGPSLLPVDGDGQGLSVVLLLNALRRALARASARSKVSEPDWAHWVRLLIDEGEMPIQHLIDTDQQCAFHLLRSHLPEAGLWLSTLYRRCFYAELSAHFAIYGPYLKENGVPSGVRQILEARCLHEDLIRDLEQLQIDASAVPFWGQEASNLAS